jgi:hypothetical protein
MKNDTTRYYDQGGKLIIKPYRMKDLAAIYGVDVRTVRRWMNKLAPAIVRKQAKYFAVQEVTAIIEALGVPKKAD